MKNEWDGKDVNLKMRGGGAFGRLINGIVFVKQSRPIRRMAKALPDWMTPNRITVFRLLLTIPIVVWIIRESWWKVLIGSIVSLFLDFLDGVVAESKGMKTKLGAILDPLVDKAFMIATLSALLAKLPIALQVTSALIILMELGIGAIRLLAMRPAARNKAERVITAAWPGKLKMDLESVGFLVMMTGFAVASPATIMCGGIIMALSLPFGLISLYQKFSA
jgi:phosphatidylglycerophosphate synthase